MDIEDAKGWAAERKLIRLDSYCVPLGTIIGSICGIITELLRQ